MMENRGTDAVYKGIPQKIKGGHGDSSSVYVLPNDVPELARLREQHDALFSLMHNKVLHASLLKSPKTILDIGCGINADVTLLLAHSFPEAKVYGIDLSEVKAERIGREVPPNVEFIKGNIDTLVQVDTRLQPGTFDLVFSRFLVAGMADWEAYIHLAASLLAPSGWVEMHDMDSHEYHDDSGQIVSAAWKWLSAFKEFCIAVLGLDWKGLSNGKGESYMRKAGLVDVSRVVYDLPFAPVPEMPETERWAKYASTGLTDMLVDVFNKAFAGQEQTERREELVNDLRATIGTGEAKHGLSLPCYVFSGRRPD